MAFTISTLIALSFSSAIASPASRLSEMDNSEDGTSEVLIEDEYSVATQMMFENEIADDFASLKIKSVKESEHSKMTVVTD